MNRENMEKLFWAGLMVLCLCSQSGCSDQTSTSVATGPSDAVMLAQAAPEIDANAIKPSQVKQTNGLSVVINPDPATVADDLHALASGNPHSPEYYWYVNGVLVQDVRINLLSAGHFRRGDTVTVSLVESERQASARVKIGNSAPRVKAVDFSDHRIHCGIDVEVNPVAEDPDGDEVDFRYVWTLNEKELAGHDGNILPGKLLQKGDRVRFSVIPNDGYLDGSPFVCDEFVIPNAAPRITSKLIPMIQDYVYHYQVRAEDPDGDDLRFSLENNPEGMTIESDTGLLRWQVDEESTGTHQVKIIVQDSDGLQASQDFTLTVSEPGRGG